MAAIHSTAPRLRLGGDKRFDDLQSDLDENDAAHIKKADRAAIGASHAALNELHEFAFSEPPAEDTWQARLALLQLTFLRIFLLVLPCGGCGHVDYRTRRRRSEPVSFLMALIRLGGIEKAYTLLVVARFDRDQNDQIDDEERREYEKQGERLVNNAINGCSNTAVVAALLVGAAHLANIGRPNAWAASTEFLEVYGQGAADRLLWLTYGLNVLVEVGALLLLGYCTFGRVLLVYVLPHPGARLTFLVESNLPGALSTAIFVLVGLTICVVALGGVLASPRVGMLATVGGPVLTCPLMWHCSYYWYQATLVLHRQVGSTDHYGLPLR